MNQQFCPECGQESPIEAKFCMECGSPLASPDARIQGTRAVAQRAAPGYQPGSGGTDWAAIAAALLAFLSLRHLSRRARNTTIVIAFLALFFGCPMVCGFAMYVMEWFARLLG
jgi:uncharacterized membrane protein YvbJ